MERFGHRPPFFQRARDERPDVSFMFVAAGDHAVAVVKIYAALGMRTAGIKLIGPGADEEGADWLEVANPAHRTQNPKRIGQSVRGRATSSLISSF